MRICKKCKIEKEDDAFYWRTGSCIECRSAYMKSYYSKNKDRILEQAAKWRTENKERDRDNHAQWRADNYERNKEISKKALTKYYGSEKDLARRKRRRDREKGTVSLDAVLEKYGMVCHICAKPIAHKIQLEFDHILPLARSGQHTEDNLKPAHEACNAWKGDRTMEEIAGLVPPLQNEATDWEVKRYERGNELRSQSMKRAWQTRDWSARNAKVSEGMKGNTNGRFTKGVPKSRKRTPEEQAAITAKIKAKWAAKTPEERAAHAAKIRAAKQ